MIVRDKIKLSNTKSFKLLIQFLKKRYRPIPQDPRMVKFVKFRGSIKFGAPKFKKMFTLKYRRNFDEAEDRDLVVTQATQLCCHFGQLQLLASDSA